MRPARGGAGGPLARSGVAVLVAGLAAGALAAPGCTTSSGDRPAEAPSFNFISDTELQSAMWQLAAGVADIDRILAPDRVVTAEDRLDVIRILKRMEDATEALGPTGWPSNHPRITRHAGDLHADLERARHAVEREPPSYYLAGTVSGACLDCHGGP
jgi:hypothetical protein